MLALKVLPERLEQTGQEECRSPRARMTTTKAGCTPPATTAAAAAELMTQAKRPGPHRRKSVLGVTSMVEDSDTDAHGGKRRRFDEELDQAAASPSAAELPSEQQQEHQQQQQQAPQQQAAGTEDLQPTSIEHAGSAGPLNGKNDAGVFSPSFQLTNRTSSGADAAAAPVGAEPQGATARAPSVAAGPSGASGLAGPSQQATEIAAAAATEEPRPTDAMQQDTEHDDASTAPHQPIVSGPATDTAAATAERTHHAHHPPPPEVPEAAESESVEDEDGMELEFDPLLFIRSLPPLEQCVPRHRAVLLPRKTRQCKRKTLVLDLDETLVHSSVEAQIPGAPPPDFTLNVSVNHIHHTIHVRRRPHLAEFMQTVAALFEVVVFTASQKPYAEQLLNILDPKRTLVKHRVFRDSCVIVDGNYLKDLTILGRDMATTCIVDNSPHAFGFQPDNGIPIESWFDDVEDSELLKLLPFLRQLAADDVPDVRPLIAKKFRLKELIAKLPLGP